MHYVSAEGIGKSFGIKPLFSNLSFHISEGDKIALIARNGSGKSTLLRILAGKDDEDEGKIWVNKDVDIALFEQNPEFFEQGTILQNIFFHKHPVMDAIRAYEDAMETDDHARQADAIAKMDELGAWDFDAKVKQILGKLRIHNLNQVVSTLSGGQRKRVALARTLIDIGFEHKHILLIMDEPTNHLDVEMVEWLEQTKTGVPDRAAAYGLLPDVDREASTLEGSCAAIVELAFADAVEDRPILLTDEGKLVAADAAIVIPCS